MQILQSVGRVIEPGKTALPRAMQPFICRVLITLALCYFFYFWLFTDAGWLHTELLSISDFIWLSDRRGSTLRQLSTLFDWRMFESSPYRLRTVSDLIEVVD